MDVRLKGAPALNVLFLGAHFDDMTVLTLPIEPEIVYSSTRSVSRLPS